MSKEHAYAYEAGYRDGSIHYELEHCPACPNVANLQEALAENAKLRELCADMFYVLEGTSCDIDGACPHRRQCDKLPECVFETRMRELRIEVDE